jgi:PLP dependent protein
VDDAAALAERLERVRGAIADAARAAGRDPDELTTIVVTKFHPVDLVTALVALGVRDVGENRHQEAVAKKEAVAHLTDAPLTWHMLGQVQTKKARQVARWADVLHSLDREPLVDALATAERETPLPCFLQINLTDDPDRGGVQPDALARLAERALGTPTLAVRGVMAVAPLDEEPARAFARLREASDLLRTLAPDADRISAGMSGDFAEAIAAGATHLRIGTAITGLRPVDR